MKLILDTNVVLDWLVFEDPSLASFTQRVRDGRVRVLTDATAIEELRRVLSYSDLALEPLRQSRVLEAYKSQTTSVKTAGPGVVAKPQVAISPEVMGEGEATEPRPAAGQEAVASGGAVAGREAVAGRGAEAKWEAAARWGPVRGREAAGGQAIPEIAATVGAQTVQALPKGFPRCRDPDDDHFLALAFRSGADVLVSRDNAVLALRQRAAPFGFRILNVRQLIAELESNPSRS